MRKLKVTMKIENQDNDVTEMTRNFEYSQGLTEESLIGMFKDWLIANGEFCEISVGLNLPIYFSEVELTEEMNKKLGN